MDNKAPDAFRTISEVADELDLPQHVLRFWESRFREIKPMKRGGGRRYYRPEDIDLLRGIRHLLYGEGYTIRGVQRILREQSVGFVQAVWQEGAAQPPHGGDNASDDEDELIDETIEIEALDEPQGLRGKLSSLIGRDLGDRGDDVEDRGDPPLQSAPMPRIDPGDRLGRGAGYSSAADEPAPPQAVRSMPAAGAGLGYVQSPGQGWVQGQGQGHGLGRDDVRQLQAALQELTECRKLIDSAVAHDD